MVVRPEEIENTFLEEDEKTLKHIENIIDSTLRREWQGTDSVTIPMPKQLRQQVQRKLIEMYVAAGWRLTFHLAKNKADRPGYGNETELVATISKQSGSTFSTFHGEKCVCRDC